MLTLEFLRAELLAKNAGKRRKEKAAFKEKRQEEIQNKAVPNSHRRKPIKQKN